MFNHVNSEYEMVLLFDFGELFLYPLGNQVSAEFDREKKNVGGNTIHRIRRYIQPVLGGISGRISKEF